jgi:hypothetical protein
MQLRVAIDLAHSPDLAVRPQQRAACPRRGRFDGRRCTRSGDSPLRSGSGWSSTSCELRYLELPCDFLVFFLRDLLAKGSILSTNAVVDIAVPKSPFNDLHYLQRGSRTAFHHLDIDVKPHQHPSNASYAPGS